ncbi:MAG: hypothetical protein ABI700_14370 [Chloroflexota bacterium]
MRFAAWIVGLVLVCALLIGGAQVIGGALPLPERLAQLHLNDCALPCWLGIRPGETKFADAAAQIRATYPQMDVSIQETQIFVQYLIHSSYGAAVISITDGTVSSITLMTWDVDGLVVGDIANRFGAPDCIPGQTILIYNFPRGYAVLVAGDDQKELWNQPLRGIEIHSYDETRINVRCPQTRP